MKRTFLIVSPPYTEKSAGVRCLHELCDALIRNGYDSHIIIIDFSGSKLFYSNDSKFFSNSLLSSNMEISIANDADFLADLSNNGVVIYPEIIIGNPLNANNVVRYFLNSDGAVTGVNSGYKSDDFCLAFSRNFFDNPDHVLCKPFIHRDINDIGSSPWGERNMDVTYIGKGGGYGDCVRVKNSLEIDRDYPKSKEELAIILKNTRYFYSWDNISSTNTDAIMCGARLVLLQDKPNNRLSIKEQYSEFGKMPFLVGNYVNGEVEVEEDENYEATAKIYIANIEASDKNWVEAVGIAAQKILTYFSK